MLNKWRTCQYKFKKSITFGGWSSPHVHSAEDGMGWSEERYSNNWPSSRTFWRRSRIPWRYGRGGEGYLHRQHSEIFCPETCNLVSLEEVPTYFASRHPFCLPEPSGNSRQVAVFAAISREPRSVEGATVMVSEPVLKNEAPRSCIGSCIRCPCCHWEYRSTSPNLNEDETKKGVTAKGGTHGRRTRPEAMYTPAAVTWVQFICCSLDFTQ